MHICSAIANMHGKLLPIEIKLSATPRQEMAREITNFRNDYGEQTNPGYVIHSGKVVLPLGAGILAVPFSLV